MRVAKEWPTRPSALGICAPQDDLAVMLAFDETLSKMRAWEQEKQDEELERARKSKPNASSGTRSPRGRRAARGALRR